MKKLISVFLALMLLFGVTAAAETPEENSFTPGTYTGEAQGIFAPVKVRITVTANKIIGVFINAKGETPELGCLAAEKLTESILKAQTPHVDALSGATVTSNAIIAAASDALVQAGADLEKLDANRKDKGEAGEKQEKEIETDVVVIGAGGAGMTAAIMLNQAGTNFVLLEKMPYAGGNTTKATGGMNAAETHYQKEQGIEDSTALFAADTMKGGHGCDHRGDAATFLCRCAGSRSGDPGEQRKISRDGTAMSREEKDWEILSFTASDLETIRGPVYVMILFASTNQRRRMFPRGKGMDVGNND